MIIDLVRKEVIENSSLRDYSSYSRKVLMFLLKVIGAGLFVALEVFIYINVDNKVNANATNGSFDFLILFLFLTLLISIIFTALKARKLLFNSFDKQVLSPLPVPKGEVVFSKVLYLYMFETLVNIVISSPILITYFVLNSFLPPFYVFGVVYGALISLFGIGISLLLSVIFEVCYRFLKLSDIAQFIVASIIVILLCFAYQVVLDLFLDALNANEGTGMFSSSLIEMVSNVSRMLLPVYTIINPTVFGMNDINFASSICISAGMIILSLLIGAIVSSFSYSYQFSSLEDKFKKKKNKNNLVLSPFKALLKKEFSLLFKDSSYTFSYTALLIMAPFLSFVVISSLNSIIYQNLRYFSVYFPDLVNGVNICLILLFISVINSGASQSISREENALEIVKYLPIDPLKQVAAKIIIPVVMSSMSLLITLIVLVASGNIDYRAFLIILFSGLILIFITTFNGLYFDMRDRGENEFKLSFINNLISVLYPFIIFAVHFGVSLTRVETFYIYIFEVITSLIILGLCLINPKKRWNKVFREMEVR